MDYGMIWVGQKDDEDEFLEDAISQNTGSSLH